MLTLTAFFTKQLQYCTSVVFCDWICCSVFGTVCWYNSYHVLDASLKYLHKQNEPRAASVEGWHQRTARAFF